MSVLAPDPQMLGQRARDLLQVGRVAAARPLVAALRRVAPQSLDAIELDARLLHNDGRSAEAEAILQAGLAAAPSAVCLLLCRAEMRLGIGEMLGGADDAAAAVMAEPSNAAAKALLGVALIQLGRFDEAALCLREAVAGRPRHPAYREALAQAVERAGDRDAALAILDQGIAAMPGNVALRVAAIMTAMRGRDPENAARLAEAARQAGVVDARVYGLLGHSSSLLGRAEAAASAYEEALKLAPEDTYVRYLVSASGLVHSAPRAPAAYLEAVFDGYASHFEAHLLSLGYRVPGLVRAALLEHRPSLRSSQPLGPVLDLGCGTGLIGVVLSDLPLHGLVGVDVSGKMLDQAREKNVYAELRLQDIETVLGLHDEGGRPAELGSWAIIVAADSLCYFGDLSGVMRGVAAGLQPGGLFLLSVEELASSAAAEVDQASGWRLGPFGRYAHRAYFVISIAEAAGLELCELRREIMRHDRGVDVEGLIVVLKRPA